MSDQLFKVVGSGTYLEDEPNHKGRQRVDGFVTAVEPDKKAAAEVLRIWFGGAFSGDHVLASNMVDAAYKGANDE